jgi:hypothetical protein
MVPTISVPVPQHGFFNEFCKGSLYKEVSNMLPLIFWRAWKTICMYSSRPKKRPRKVIFTPAITWSCRNVEFYFNFFSAKKALSNSTQRKRITFKGGPIYADQGPVTVDPHLFTKPTHCLQKTADPSSTFQIWQRSAEPSCLSDRALPAKASSLPFYGEPLRDKACSLPHYGGLLPINVCSLPHYGGPLPIKVCSLHHYGGPLNAKLCSLCHYGGPLPIKVCSLPHYGGPLPINVCSLPINDCSLPIKVCSLPHYGGPLPAKTCSLPHYGSSVPAKASSRLSMANLCETKLLYT